MLVHHLKFQIGTSKATEVNTVAKAKKSSISPQRIERAILLIRGEKVLLDEDLAALYGVPTKRLLQAVKRNLARFPDDFMFRLTSEEAEAMRSHFVTASKRNVRYLPYAFTEQGVAMLSSVLRSPRAVEVNIAIMRAFVQLRRWAIEHADLARRIDELESRYDQKFAVVRRDPQADGVAACRPAKGNGLSYDRQAPGYGPAAAKVGHALVALRTPREPSRLRGHPCWRRKCRPCS